MNIKTGIFILVLLSFLLIPLVSAVSFDEAFNSVKKDIDITPLTAVYRLPDLGPHQTVYEYFTGIELFKAGSDGYYVYHIDYYSGAPYGHPIHNFFVNKETGYVLKIYGEFPQADENGKIIPYESVLVEPQIGNWNKYPGETDSGQGMGGITGGITGYQTVNVGGGCPIKCPDPKLDDRKPPKSFLFYIKGHDSNGAFDNSLIEAKKCKKYDDVTILTPNSPEGVTGESRWVKDIGAVSLGEGYDDISDIKRKLSELMGKVCCSDKVTIYVAAHGDVLYTISLNETLDEDTKERFKDFLMELYGKYVDSEGEMLSEEEIKELGLTYEEYYEAYRLTLFLISIFEGYEFPGYQLRNLAEAMELLKNKIGIPEWMQEMFASMLDCMKDNQASPELINSCIEKEFKLATNAKIKSRHVIQGKEGEEIDTADLINSLKDIKSCYKELILDSCCAGGVAKSVKDPGLSVVAPSKYIDYVSGGVSMCQMLEACKELVPKVWPMLTPPQKYYGDCIEALYKCEGRIFEEFKKSGMACKEQIEKQEELCKDGENETEFEEQSFVYKHKEKCECCLVTDRVMLVPDLVVYSVSVVVDGSGCEVDYTVSNIGDGAAGTSTVKIVGSEEEKFELISGLVSGASYSGSVFLTCSEGETISVVADVYDETGESDEANNVNSGIVFVQPSSAVERCIAECVVTGLPVDYCGDFCVQSCVDNCEEKCRSFLEQGDFMAYEDCARPCLDKCVLGEVVTVQPPGVDETVTYPVDAAVQQDIVSAEVGEDEDVVYYDGDIESKTSVIERLTATHTPITERMGAARFKAGMLVGRPFELLKSYPGKFSPIMTTAIVAVIFGLLLAFFIGRPSEKK